MKTQFQNQARGCIGEEFDWPIGTECKTKGCHQPPSINGTYCWQCYEQRQAFLRDDEPYHANHYEWRWLYVPCAAAVALIALLWWLWPRLIALRMAGGQP